MVGGSGGAEVGPKGGGGGGDKDKHGGDVL